MNKFDRFIIFPWGNVFTENRELAVERLKSIKECGFNASCFVPETLFDTCRELDLMIYCQPARAVNEDGSTNYRRFIGDPDATKEDVLKIMRKALEGLPCDVRSVYIEDEPGAGLFPRLKLYSECVHEIMPWAEAYFNLFPNYAVCGAPNLSQLETETYEEYLGNFAETVKPDAISFDNYQVLISNNFNVSGGRESYFNNLLQARAVCDKYDIPLQTVCCCSQLRHNQTIPTLGNLALQAYTSLAAGARVISWYLFFAINYYLFSPIDDTTGKDAVTPSFYLLREVNRRILSLGQELFGMEYKGMYFTNTADLSNARPVSECPAIKDFSSDTDCMVGHYIDKNGQDAILIANCNPERSTKISVDIGGEAEMFSTEAQSWIKPMLVNRHGQESPMWLEPGGGILIRVKKG
jgi:hypothetical protein